MAQVDYLAILAEAWQQHLAPREADAPTVVSTFAGCGGSSLGYSMAGYRELLAVEWDDNAVQTFKLNFPGVPVYHGDIAKLSVGQCLSMTGLEPGQLDVLDGSPPCFPAGTTITTRVGKVPIEQVTEGMNALTHMGHYQPVLKTMRRSYSGNVYTIQVKYGRKPIVCTAEHPIFARRRVTLKRDCRGRKNSSRYKAYLEPEWIAAKDLNPGDVVCEPHIKEDIALEIPAVIEKQRINLTGVSGTDKAKMQLRERPCNVEWTNPAMAWMLGFYLAEGHTRGHNPTLTKNGPCRREVTFSVADKEAVDIAERLVSLGFHPIVQQHSQGSSRITVTSLDLWALVQVMCKGASSKFIPDAFCVQSREWQVAFLDGYFTGDGCIRLNGKSQTSTLRKATTVSWEIAIGIARMVASVFNLVAGIEVLYPAGFSKIQGRDVTIKEAYSVGYRLSTSDRVRPGFVDEYGAWLPIAGIESESVTGLDVYNLEVAEDHSYTAEGIAVHNCQGFSTAGKREMDDPRNQLFREYVRLLQGLQPKVFVMENVSGMVKGKMKLVFAEILRELKASGYNVSCRLLNAMYFHVPQSRERLIFIGVREDLGIEPSHPKAEGKPIDVRGAFEGIVGDGDCPGMSEQYQKYWRQAGHGGVVGKQETHRRLLWNRPSYVLQKAAGYGGVYHPDKPRPLSTQERKRIGSFPDEFRFTGWNAAIERIGNSVPPLMMRAIARHVRQEILRRISV
jgi:DNA (cytosine-5)-methyltransferase 1